jgi:hypothetical protein
MAGRGLILVFGVLGFVGTAADTIRLFLRAPSRSAPALAAWALWCAWLVLPLGWAVRSFKRATIADLAAYLILGYGTAAMALRVLEVCLPGV